MFFVDIDNCDFDVQLALQKFQFLWFCVRYRRMCNKWN